MRKVYVTFGGKAYDATLELAVRDAVKFGADEIRVYDDAWLRSTPFYELNRWIFENDYGLGAGYHCGWCCWKAFILLQEFKRLNCGDIVLYVDGDTYPIASMQPLFDIAERDKIVLFEAQGCSNSRFTKEECFLAMGCGHIPRESPHACGRFQLFTVGDYRSEQFLYEWLTYMLNPMCQFNAKSTEVPERPEMYRHSSDQSILSLLALKYGIPLHREACQNGFPVQAGHGQPEDSSYDQIFCQVWAEGNHADPSGSRFRNV